MIGPYTARVLGTVRPNRLAPRKLPGELLIKSCHALPYFAKIRYAGANLWVSWSKPQPEIEISRKWPLWISLSCRERVPEATQLSKSISDQIKEGRHARIEHS